MDCKLIVSELANSDLDEIVGYIINDLKSPMAAANLLIKNYLLLYRFEEETKTVQVARFFYGGRNYAKYL